MNIVKSYFYLICIFLNSEFMVKIFFVCFPTSVPHGTMKVSYLIF